MKNIHPPFAARQAFTLLALATVAGLSACATTSLPPPLPDGTNRVPVNARAASAQVIEAKSQVATQAPADSKPERPSTVLETVSPKGKTVRVSLLTTLDKIARNTGLRLRDNDLADETLTIVPNDDPFNVLRQLAGKTRYRISIDRNVGRLIVNSSPPANGLVVLRETDAQPVEQIGAPVALPAMPTEPVPMSEALRLLAPDDFEVGYAGEIDPNIRVDLSNVWNWMEGLERVALQTPYRMVFDWNKKLVYAKPIEGKVKESKK